MVVWIWFLAVCVWRHSLCVFLSVWVSRVLGGFMLDGCTFDLQSFWFLLGCLFDGFLNSFFKNSMRAQKVAELLRKRDWWLPEKVLFLGLSKQCFGKMSLCLGDICHFRHFRRCPGPEEQTPSRFVGRTQYPNFRQNRLFSALDKNTVFQNDRFDNPYLRLKQHFWKKKLLARKTPQR